VLNSRNIAVFFVPVYNWVARNGTCRVRPISPGTRGMPLYFGSFAAGEVALINLPPGCPTELPTYLDGWHLETQKVSPRWTYSFGRVCARTDLDCAARRNYYYTSAMIYTARARGGGPYNVSVRRVVFLNTR